MSYIQDIDFDFHVGDTYDVSPVEGVYIIGRILALGGECYVDGTLVIVSALPDQEEPPAAEAPAPVEAPEIPAPVEPEPEAPGLLDAPPVEEVVEQAPAPVAEVEAPAEVSEAPIKRAESVTKPQPQPQVTRGRTKKTVTPADKVNSAKLGEI